MDQQPFFVERHVAPSGRTFWRLCVRAPGYSRPFYITQCAEEEPAVALAFHLNEAHANTGDVAENVARVVYDAITKGRRRA